MFVLTKSLETLYRGTSQPSQTAKIELSGVHHGYF